MLLHSQAFDVVLNLCVCVVCVFVCVCMCVCVCVCVCVCEHCGQMCVRVWACVVR